MRNINNEEGQLKRKLDITKEVLNSANLIFLQGLAKQYSDMKPDNQDLQKFVTAVVEVSLYTTSLQLDREAWKHIYNDIRNENNDLKSENSKLRYRVTELESEIAFDKEN
jgi:predicted nuclease with TOPRIM domain